MESLSLIDVMRECQSMVEAQAVKRSIQVKFVQFNSDWCVYADLTRLKQVMLNLLSNAIKYNRNRGMVKVSCTRTLKHIKICIKDNGEGLSPEKLVQLFQPFNRLGQETGIEQGVGIGLVITRQLVELMGGTITAASTLGVGSEFCIELGRGTTTSFAIGQIRPIEDQLMNAIDEAQRFFEVDLVNTTKR
jgi:signal transduction histidine kinase